MGNVRVKTRRIVMMGMMLALMLVLSWLEHSLPPVPGLPPGAKLGLANVISMYVLFFIGGRDALCLTLLKSLFVLLTRGGMAGFLSLCGGLFSFLLLALAMRLGGGRLSYFLLSALGAVAHNMGQLFGACAAIGSGLVWYYAPVLILSGLLMGCGTGVALRVVLPVMDKLDLRR